MAETYILLADAYLAPEVAYPPALDAANRALALAPDLPEALGVRALVRAVYTWEMDEARGDADRTLARKYGMPLPPGAR